MYYQKSKIALFANYKIGQKRKKKGGGCAHVFLSKGDSSNQKGGLAVALTLP